MDSQNAVSKLLQIIERKREIHTTNQVVRAEFKWVFTIISKRGFPKLADNRSKGRLLEKNQPLQQPSGEGRCGFWCCEHEDEQGNTRKD